MWIILGKFQFLNLGKRNEGYCGRGEKTKYIFEVRREEIGELMEINGGNWVNSFEYLWMKVLF